MQTQLRLRDFPIGKKKGRGVHAQAYAHVADPTRIFLRTKNSFKAEIFSNWVQGPHAPVIYSQARLWDDSYLLEMENLEVGSKSQGEAKKRFRALMEYSWQGLVLFSAPSVQKDLELILLPSELSCIHAIFSMAYNYAKDERSVVLDLKMANIRVRNHDTLVFTDICHIKEERI